MLELELLNLYRARGWTLAFAESATGGDLAARLTKIAGASDVVLGSIVSYSNNAKKKVLGVPSELLGEPVSKDVALAMLKGLMNLLNPTVGVAVTGYAGPTGHAVGTFWLAFQKQGETPEAFPLFLQGDRVHLIETAGTYIYHHLVTL